jgi:hypothetical protein
MAATVAWPYLHRTGRVAILLGRAEPVCANSVVRPLVRSAAEPTTNSFVRRYRQWHARGSRETRLEEPIFAISLSFATGEVVSISGVSEGPLQQKPLHCAASSLSLVIAETAVSTTSIYSDPPNRMWRSTIPHDVLQPDCVFLLCDGVRLGVTPTGVAAQVEPPDWLTDLPQRSAELRSYVPIAVEQLLV